MTMCNSIGVRWREGHLVKDAKSELRPQEVVYMDVAEAAAFLSAHPDCRIVVATTIALTIQGEMRRSK